jgi:hypothetical protein
MYHQMRILNVMIVSTLGAGAMLSAADSQLPVSPFYVPPPGTVGAGNSPTSSTPAPSPTDTGPAFTGFVDSTYNYNLNRPQSGTNGYYSFMNQANTFAVNNAQFEINGSPKGDAAITYMAKINFGTDATSESSTNRGVATNTSNMDVEEAWGAYVDPTSHVGLKVGKFVTYEGIEVIESNGDPTITRGLLFSLAEPFTTTGVLATYQATPIVDIAFGVVNGWDELTASNSGKTIVAKMGINYGDPLTLTISGLYGPEQTGDASDKRGSVDLTGISKVIPHVDINFQVNFGWETNAIPANDDPTKVSKWFGVSFQPLAHIGDKVTIGARIELFDDQDGARTGVKQHLSSFSIAPGYQLTPHFLLRGEARLDASTEPSYEDQTGQFVKRSQAVLTAEAIYNF